MPLNDIKPISQVAGIQYFYCVLRDTELLLLFAQRICPQEVDNKSGSHRFCKTEISIWREV